MNCLLQALFHNSAFRAGLYAFSPANKESESGVVHQLQLLFGYLELGVCAYYDPTPFTTEIGLAPQVQQDVQEFFKALSTYLEEHFSASPNPMVRTLVQDLFSGQMAYVTKCKSCKTASKTKSTFYELDMHIDGVATIEKSIENYIRPEELSGSNQYHCSYCNAKRDASRFIELSPQLPQILNFQLMRFVFDWENETKKKVKTAIEFPEFLDMNEFVNAATDDNPIEETEKMDEDIEEIKEDQININETGESNEQGEKSEEKEDFEVEEIAAPVSAPKYASRAAKVKATSLSSQKARKPRKQSASSSSKRTSRAKGGGNPELIYRLSYVLVHRGQSAYGGHYIAFVRDETSGTWWKFNDETAEPVTDLAKALASNVDVTPSVAKASKKTGTSNEAIKIDDTAAEDEDTSSGTNKNTSKKGSAKRAAAASSSSSEGKSNESSVANSDRWKSSSAYMLGYTNIGMKVTPSVVPAGVAAQVEAQNDTFKSIVDQQKDVLKTIDKAIRERKAQRDKLLKVGLCAKPDDSSLQVLPTADTIAFNNGSTPKRKTSSRSKDATANETEASFGDTLQERLVSQLEDCQWISTAWYTKWLKGSDMSLEAPVQSTESAKTSETEKMEISDDVIAKEPKTIKMDISEDVEVNNEDKGGAARDTESSMDIAKEEEKEVDAKPSNTSSSEQEVVITAPPVTKTPPKLGNYALLCSHGRLDPLKVGEAKRISSAAWEILSSLTTFGPSLDKYSMCSECALDIVHYGASKNADEKSKATILSSIKGERTKKGTNNDIEDSYWISKDWLAAYSKKMMKNSELDPTVNSALQCPHGLLSPDTRLRRRISSTQWEALKEAFPAAIEFKSVLTTAPVPKPPAPTPKAVSAKPTSKSTSSAKASGKGKDASTTKQSAATNGQQTIGTFFSVKRAGNSQQSNSSGKSTSESIVVDDFEEDVVKIDEKLEENGSGKQENEICDESAEDDEIKSSASNDIVDETNLDDDIEEVDVEGYEKMAISKDPPMLSPEEFENASQVLDQIALQTHIALENNKTSQASATSLEGEENETPSNGESEKYTKAKPNLFDFPSDASSLMDEDKEQSEGADVRKAKNSNSTSKASSMLPSSFSPSKSNTPVPNAIKKPIAKKPIPGDGSVNVYTEEEAEEEDVCSTCLQNMHEDAEARMVVTKRKTSERRRFSAFLGSIPSSMHNRSDYTYCVRPSKPGTYYLISLPWAIEWRHFLKENEILRTPGAITNASMHCRHRQLIFDPLAFFNDTEKNVFFAIATQETFAGLKTIYKCDTAVRMTLTPEGKWKDYLYCLECMEEHHLSRETRAFNFEKDDLYLIVEDCRTNKRKRPAGGLTETSRSRGNKKHFISGVSYSDTVGTLKMKIFEKYDVAPAEMVLINSNQHQSQENSSQSSISKNQKLKRSENEKTKSDADYDSHTTSMDLTQEDKESTPKENSNNASNAASIIFIVLENEERTLEFYNVRSDRPLIVRLVDPMERDVYKASDERNAGFGTTVLVGTKKNANNNTTAPSALTSTDDEPTKDASNDTSLYEETEKVAMAEVPDETKKSENVELPSSRDPKNAVNGELIDNDDMDPETRALIEKLSQEDREEERKQKEEQDSQRANKAQPRADHTASKPKQNNVSKPSLREAPELPKKVDENRAGISSSNPVLLRDSSALDVGSWVCKACETSNSDLFTACDACSTPSHAKQWKCVACKISIHATLAQCPQCGIHQKDAIDAGKFAYDLEDDEYEDVVPSRNRRRKNARPEDEDADYSDSELAATKKSKRTARTKAQQQKEDEAYEEESSEGYKSDDSKKRRARERAEDLEGAPTTTKRYKRVQ